MKCSRGIGSAIVPCNWSWLTLNPRAALHCSDCHSLLAISDTHTVWRLQTELDSVPLYVAVKEVVNKEGKVEAVEIDYCTFYAYNGPYKIGLSPLAAKVGAHDGDWEHFTVRQVSRNAQTEAQYHSCPVDPVHTLAIQKCVEHPF